MEVLMHFTNKFFILFFYFFDTILTYFWSPQFSFFLCDKCNVVILKIHYESIIFLEFIQNIYDNSH
jgi:hypothetical protein